MTDRQWHVGWEQEQRPSAPIPNARTPVVPSLAGPTPLGPLSRSGGASPWPRP